MELLKEYQNALALAGTVAIPSRFPASGQLYIVWDSALEKPAVRFLKLVQIVNETEFRAWLFAPEQLGAMRYCAPAQDGKAAGDKWTLITGNEARSMLGTVAPKPMGDGQIPTFQSWLGAAIVYLPEAAPVVTRYEFATTAAESIDDFEGALCSECPDPS